MARSKIVTINDKTVSLKELKIGELETLFDSYKDILKPVLSANSVDDIKSGLFNTMYDKIPELFPQLTADDVKNAYPSDMEELIGAFVDVNFFGLKKVGMPLVKMMLQGIQKMQ